MSLKRYHPKTVRCLRRQPEFSRLDRSRSFFLLGLTFLVLLFMGASIFYISTHVEVVGIGYQIDQALSKKQSLIEENKRLSLEIARLKSPTRIESFAKENLNLIQPQLGQVVYLSKLEESPYLKQIAKAPEPKASAGEVATKPRKKSTPKKAASKPKAVVKKQAKARKEKAVPAKPKKELMIAKIIPAPSGAGRPLKAKKIRKDPPPAVLLDPLP